jgi:hypothetical protein
MEEISLYYNYYDTSIYNNQYEKTFQNGGYIKIPFQNNKSLTEPNLIISNGNTSIKYKTENIYIFNNIHKIPLFYKSSKYKVLPPDDENEEPQTNSFADGELVIEHTPLTNGTQKVYTVFLLKTSTDSLTMVDELIMPSQATANLSYPTPTSEKLLSQSTSNSLLSTLRTDEKVKLVNTISLNDILNKDGEAKSMTNKNQTVFIFKKPILYTSFDFHSSTLCSEENSFSSTLRSDEKEFSVANKGKTEHSNTLVERDGMDNFQKCNVGKLLKSKEYLFPVFKKQEYNTYKVYVQLPDKSTTNIFKTYPREPSTWSPSIVRSVEYHNLPSSVTANSFSSILDSDEKMNNNSSEIIAESKDNFIGTSPDVHRTVGDKIIGTSPDVHRTVGDDIFSYTSLRKIEGLTGVAIDDNIEDNKPISNSKKYSVEPTELQLTNNLKLVCNSSGNSEGNVLFEPLRLWLIMLICVLIAVYLIIVIYCYNLCLKSDNFTINNKYYYLLVIHILLAVIFFPLLTSWMLEIKYIGMFSVLFVIAVIITNSYNFINYAYEKQDTSFTPLNMYNLFIQYSKRFINDTYEFITVIVFFLFGYGISNSVLACLVTQKDANDNKWIYFNTVRYVNSNYPGIYWSRMPNCNYDDSETRYNQPDFNNAVPCDDFKKSIMSGSNSEIMGVFFLPLLTYLLYFISDKGLFDKEYKVNNIKFVIAAFAIVAAFIIFVIVLSLYFLIRKII